MLLPQIEERGRRFTLALRAGIPVLILVFLVFTTTIYQDKAIVWSLKDGVLLSAITFIAIYFIYFLMNLSVQETLLDHASQSFNKKTFFKKLEHYQPQFIAYLNIENLSSLNENYSTEEIDNLLYTLTSQLHLLFKQYGLEAILGRHRGTGFLIGINDNFEHIEIVLEEMIAKNPRINGIEIDYKFAIIANSNENFEKSIVQLQDIIQSQSLLRDKEQKSSLINDAKELSKIEQEVINALKMKKLQLSFRPLLNTKKETIDTYEISIKLKSETQKEILPRTFLPIINRLGLGREYDLILIKHLISILPLVDEGLSFSFNLSPFSLRDTTFQQNVFEALEASKINPSRLIIQLYERKTHHNLGSYLKTLNSFRSHGLRICIDNFGSSNASMEYMKHFKFDMVQFDRDYVTHLEDENSLAILQSLITMSKDLKIKTVAKWVDNEAQEKHLMALEIDYLQGFGIGKSLNEEEFIQHYN